MRAIPPYHPTLREGMGEFRLAPTSCREMGAESEEWLEGDESTDPLVRRQKD